MYEYLASNYDIQNLSPTINSLILIYLTSSTEIWLEIKILIGIFVFITAPQALAYLFSSFTGCASAPPMVNYVVKYTALWAAKILSFGSGIFMYFVIFPVSNLPASPEFTQYSCWISAISYLEAAFSFLLYYFMGGTLIKILLREGKFRWLEWFHSWATRHYPKDDTLSQEVTKALATASNEVARSLVDAIGDEITKRLDSFAAPYRKQLE